MRCASFGFEHHSHGIKNFLELRMNYQSSWIHSDLWTTCLVCLFRVEDKDWIRQVIGQSNQTTDFVAAAAAARPNGEATPGLLLKWRSYTPKRNPSQGPRIHKPHPLSLKGVWSTKRGTYLDSSYVCASNMTWVPLRGFSAQ